jgi:HEAT repeat protein
MKDPRAVEPLIAALRDTDPIARKNAADALSNIKDPRAVEPLIAALKDADPIVRQVAFSSLARGGIAEP